ncbi:MAG: response regulator [Methyloprofundus sp.]|nr:response regulator [Methyloprofundus sp.]
MPIELPKQILIVDDEADIRSVVQITLEISGGLEAETCSSGAAAIEFIAKTPPDLVLLDVMMPGMDGPETLKRLKAEPATASIPVIFMTAKVQPAEVEEYYRMGVAGVVSKPFNPRELVNSVMGFWTKIHAE